MSERDEHLRGLKGRRRHGEAFQQAESEDEAVRAPLVSQGPRSSPPRPRVTPDALIRQSRGRGIWQRIFG